MQLELRWTTSRGGLGVGFMRWKRLGFVHVCALCRTACTLVELKGLRSSHTSRGSVKDTTSALHTDRTLGSALQ